MKTALILLTLIFLISCKEEIHVPKDQKMKTIIERELPLTNILGIEFDIRKDQDNWDYLTVIRSKSKIKNVEKTLNINLYDIRKNPIW